MTDLNPRVKTLLEDMREHLRDPKGRTEIESMWLNEINKILSVECDHCLFGGWIIALPEDDQEYATIARCSCQEGDELTQEEVEKLAVKQSQQMKTVILDLLETLPQWATGEELKYLDCDDMVEWMVTFIGDTKSRLGL